MKYKVIQNNNNLDYTSTVLNNRGIPKEEIEKYINTTDKVINEPETFGEETLRAAARALISGINSNARAFIVVDADCDGYTSSAILINYLYKQFPAWVTNNVKYFIHSGKQHGLSDCIDLALEYDLVICPDSGK